MTAQEIEERVKAIEAGMSDWEGAHGDEDQLYVDLLRAIADGTAEDPAKCAQAALKSQDLDFLRVAA